MIAEKNVDITVAYGLGANCEGSVARESLRGIPVRNLIQLVASMPQPNPQSKRTAAVLRDVLRTGRRLDVEVSHNPEDELAVGTPVKLDDVLLRQRANGSDAEEPEDISLKVSEPYRGGARA